ncbi:nucleotide-binding domain-containing protein [Gymnopus androsaceus JB14]|uniref:Nucleotide-binding domain-containing protein n=1 Tax=Gymnopus androsaceus JB14 TaxID=1447944 RepID=A0A6A4HFD5_9AGAR|nr:nucleotide-binding domain-containing protein [Gymnopus androsaceus JB14]
MANSSTTQKKEIIVVGAGVIGLTTAIKIQEEKGSEYHVTIIAETFPTDPRTIKYTSFWAGANNLVTRTDDLNLRRMERETFDVVWAMSEPGSGIAEGCFLRCTDYTYFTEENSIPWTRSIRCSFMPDFRELSADELIPGAVQGFTFTTVTFDIPRYLPYLLARFTASGGSIIHGNIGHIQQVLEAGTGLFDSSNSLREFSSPDAVILCVGLGARFLGGIEDKDDMPMIMDVKDGLPPYIIPRKGGDVILGGTFHPNDWFPKPRPEITERILTGALKLHPALAPPEIRAVREPTVDDLRPLIVDVGVGFRPYRHGGVRVGVEWMESTSGFLKEKGKKVPVVFNYGHGGNGYQSSWGSATIALEYLEAALKNPEGLKSS